MRHGSQHVKSTKRPTRRSTSGGGPPPSRLHLEQLETRCLLSFDPAVNYLVGANPYEALIGHFNTDNIQDLAVVNISSNSVSVLLGNADTLGNPDGTFGTAQDSLTSLYPRSAAIGDFNNDGHNDLATLNNADLSVLIGNGNGTFQPPQNIVLPDQLLPYAGGVLLPQSHLSVAVGDVNGDGNMDLVATGSTFFSEFAGCGYYGCYYNYYYDGHLNILIGNGAGGFAEPITQIMPGAYPLSAALDHFNADATLDLAVADSNYGRIQLLTGNGDGTFTAVSDNYPGTTPSSVLADDVNADGITDLIARSYYGAAVMKGNGDGTFQTPQNTALGFYPNSLAVGDINDDGMLDLTASSVEYHCTSYGYYGCYDSYYTGAVHVLLGYGDGTFATATKHDLGIGYALGVAAADVDGDGLPDVAVTDYFDNQVGVLINAGHWSFPPNVTISDASPVTEGNSGTVNAAFTLTLSAASSEPVSFSFTTSNGSAWSGSDYSYQSVTVTFDPGQTTKTVDVVIIGDSMYEGDEIFYVYLSNPVNVTIVDNQAIGTILNDDVRPTITIDDKSITEGNKGRKSLVFTVSLTSPSTEWISVNFATANGTARVSDSDYIAASGTVWFAPGQTTATITVQIRGDRKREADETFTVNLSNASSNAAILDGIGIGTILNDDRRGDD